MEIGAVKQAFNNEVILLKKKLAQAKIQIIHKLTRKAKQLAEKKAPEPMKEKLKRKSEAAVSEVMIIKKIKPKNIAKFIVTHKGELKDFLNKPIIDNNKACARLLLHKALQEKYNFIRGRFANVAIQDLFMSRLERRKLKKEAKEKQKNKKKSKNKNVDDTGGDENVQDEIHKDKLGDSDIEKGSDDNESSDANPSDSESDEDVEPELNCKVKNSLGKHKKTELITKQIEQQDTTMKLTSIEKLQKEKPNTKQKLEVKDCNVKPIKNKPEKKQKNSNKNKNFNEKILQRKFAKDSGPVTAEKAVDPFFMTASGENYMTVVEPHCPDEFKDEHKQGNRKLRRAAMFGYSQNMKPRKNNNYSGQSQRYRY